MKAGDLREQIKILQPIDMKNEYGSGSRIWKDVITTRAKATYNTGSRLNENNEIVHSYTITFTTRCYHNILEDMRIIWKGKKYRILAINKEVKKQLSTIITELINE